MIIKRPCKPQSDHAGEYDVEYFGKDAETFLKSIDWECNIQYLGKECMTWSNEQGIIIGIEDSNTYMDYYFIVYIPETKKVKYESINSSVFINNIKV